MFLEKSKYKKSRQRESILKLLKNAEDHPSADWIYFKLKKDFPNLSLGTVYRNLQILIDQGKISKIDFGSTFDRYDANMGPHYHFICTSCNTIVDLEIPVNNELNALVTETTPYSVEKHRIEFYGLCDKCRK